MNQTTRHSAASQKEAQARNVFPARFKRGPFSRQRNAPRPLAKLSRKSNQVASGRIRWFESYMPSHAVGLRERYTSVAIR